MFIGDSMNKMEIKELLDSLKYEKPEKLDEINYLIKKLEGKSEKEVENLKYSKEELKELFLNMLEREKNESSKNSSVNKLFEYGISGDCVHLHLPGDFHKMFQKFGKIKASAEIGKYLIDAVNKINNYREMGDAELKKCSSIYMISPIFYAPTFYPNLLRNGLVRGNIKTETPIFKLFRLMGLETRTYLKEDLYKPKNDEAKLAVKHFGSEKDIGAVSLSFEKLNSGKFKRKLSLVSNFLDRISKEIEKDENVR